jgi:hypothetical protein
MKCGLEILKIGVYVSSGYAIIIQTVPIRIWVTDLFGGVLTIAFRRQWGKPEFLVLPIYFIFSG